MSADGPRPERQPSISELGTELLIRRMVTLLGIALILFGGLWWYVGLPSVPRPLEVTAVAAAFTLPYAYIVGHYVRNKFGLGKVIVVDLDAADQFKGAVYEFPLPDFRALEVTDGQLEQWSPYVYAGRGLDLDDDYRIEGTPRTMMTDRELIAHTSAVSLIRRHLEPRARRWDQLREQLPWLVRARAADEAATTMEAIEPLLLPGADAAGASIDELEEQLDDGLPDDVDISDVEAEDFEDIPDELREQYELDGNADEVTDD